MSFWERFFSKEKPEIPVRTPPGGTRRYLVELLDHLPSWERTEEFDPDNNYWQFISLNNGHRITILGPSDEPLPDSLIENYYEQVYQGNLPGQGTPEAKGRR